LSLCESAKRDVSAAKRFFKKLMRAEHRRLPFSISVDKNAAYPEAFCASQEERTVPKDCKFRRVKYLNNVIEQDHRFVKKKVRASQCFKTFHTSERTIEGIEAINMVRKGQVKRLAVGDAHGQAKFVASLFGLAAWTYPLHGLACLEAVFETHPSRQLLRCSPANRIPVA
jgi:transposase, IS6 family